MTVDTSRLNFILNCAEIETGVNLAVFSMCYTHRCQVQLLV